VYGFVSMARRQKRTKMNRVVWRWVSSSRSLKSGRELIAYYMYENDVDSSVGKNVVTERRLFMNHPYSPILNAR
jgi:hypothetical protein